MPDKERTFHGYTHPTEVLEELRAAYAPLRLCGRAVWDLHGAGEVVGEHVAVSEVAESMDEAFARSLVRFGCELDDALDAVEAWCKARKEAANA